MKRTKRGFRIYGEFIDTYGNDIRIQQSSSAEKHCVWIFSERNGESVVCHLGQWQSYSPHLDVKQAKKLITALQRFIGDKDE